MCEETDPGSERLVKSIFKGIDVEALQRTLVYFYKLSQDQSMVRRLITICQYHSVALKWSCNLRGPEVKLYIVRWMNVILVFPFNCSQTLLLLYDLFVAELSIGNLFLTDFSIIQDTCAELSTGWLICNGISTG